MKNPTNIVALPKATTINIRGLRRRTPTALKVARQYAPATGLGSVIAVLLGLSLTHLSRGIQIVTGCDAAEGTAMAVGLDLLIVSLEVAMVTVAGTKAQKAVAKFANPALVAAFGWSAGLNAFAFAVNSADWIDPMRYVAGGLGASIPALIYAGTRAWAALAINSKQH
jgi:hypothetical protein